ncbi:MAG TPA: SDR family NAD(P)-dependent oxidoreductase [Acidobacteriota bacterium]|nr:SDR family NAD(P)-dependent oxidoreductase [Acidobacteriota bacterium]HQF88387.1 SDR family NAD(P)-dependent oxidoreductase [Acidobacteriota bacterium]HQG92910.1 SDR family NAD(P)-dependent oxidoreductase [Acidobacteriota bacterium]
MKRFPSRRVLITGAGSGLGRALALEFARRGWRVAVAEIDAGRAKETARRVRAAGGEALEIPCDVCRPEDLEAAARVVGDAWGGLDILVNNVGSVAAGRFEQIPLAEWDRILTVNLRSVIHGCRAFIPGFKAQGGGHIVNIASAAGFATYPEMAGYNASKAAVIALSETLRVELAPHRVGVTVVCPTYFRSNIMEGFTSTDARQRRMAEVLLRRSRTTADAIARRVVRAVGRGRFRVITPLGGRAIWLCQRLFPGLYLRGLTAVYRSGYLEKTFRGRRRPPAADQRP